MVSRWSMTANVLRFTVYVPGFLVRQQERNWSVAHEEGAPARLPRSSPETIRPVTCLKQQERKMDCQLVYEVYE